MKNPQKLVWGSRILQTCELRYKNFYFCRWCHLSKAEKTQSRKVRTVPKRAGKGLKTMSQEEREVFPGLPLNFRNPCCSLNTNVD